MTEFSRQREEALGEGEAERLGYLTHELRNRLSTAMLSFAAVKSGRVAVAGSTGAIVERSLAAMRDLLDTTISEVRLAAGSQEPKRMSIARFMHEAEGERSRGERGHERDAGRTRNEGEGPHGPPLSFAQRRPLLVAGKPPGAASFSIAA